MNRGRWIRSTALSCCLIVSSVFGQEVSEIPFSNWPDGSAALGGGVRFGQSPYLADESSDQRGFDLVPLYLYRGKRLFARGTAGGVHLLRSDAIELNLLAQYRFQKLDPDSNAYFAGLEERKQTLDAGLEFVVRQKWGEIKLDWVTDTLNRHNGQEASFLYRYRFDAGPWSYSPFVSWTWQDENLTNYYFGIREEEATPERPSYLPGRSQWVQFGLNTSWHVSDHFLLFGNVAFGGADSVVANSPLVEEDSFVAAFVGGTYLFGSVRQPDYIMDEERIDEWSWRVNYGYQADGNIISEIDHGNLSKSKIADTNIAGITLSKLISDGKRFDFLGRFAVFHHDEKSEGNGQFLSYAAYIMAMGQGYSPWTNDEVFRWGFGFGVSYAEDIPIAEQRKQAASDDNTSHFLNYLELSLDFPLRRLSKARWLQGCYAGVSVVHRSGIFGTSDILGVVSGGSDWITAHLECTHGS